MNIIPYRNIQIETEKSVESCMKQLIANVNTAKGPITGVNYVVNFFRGTLADNTFSLRRISKKSHSPKPYVNGTMNVDGTGSIIDVEVKLPIRIYLNFGIIYLTVLINIIFGLMDGLLEWYKYIIPVFLLVFGYAFILTTFNQEVELAEEKLMELFSEKESTSNNT